MRFTLSQRVKIDLDEIAAWIAMDNPRRAVEVLRELRAAFREIARAPKHYRLRPEIGEGVRLAVAGHHVILFWIDGKVVRFERAVYGGRNLPALDRWPHWRRPFIVSVVSGSFSNLIF